MGRLQVQRRYTDRMSIGHTDIYKPVKRPMRHVRTCCRSTPSSRIYLLSGRTSLRRQKMKSRGAPRKLQSGPSRQPAAQQRQQTRPHIAPKSAASRQPEGLHRLQVRLQSVQSRACMRARRELRAQQKELPNAPQRWYVILHYIC